MRRLRGDAGTAKQREIAARREQVAELVRSGTSTVRELAKIIGVSAATISRDLKYLDRVWEQNAEEDYGSAQEEILEKLAKTQQESMDSWELSRQPFRDLDE